MTFFLAAVRGTLPGEIFQFGFAYDGVGSAQDLADAVQANATAWLGGAVPSFPTTTVFSTCQVYELNLATGALGPDQGSANLAVSGGLVGALPNECAMVVSLRSGTPGDNGRFYLPAPAKAALNNDGLIEATYLDGQADRTKTFFDALSTAMGGGSPLIWHRPAGAVPGSGSVVTTIDIGNVVDAQRRRRNKQIESRASRVLA
jgi:hypothetical protein